MSQIYKSPNQAKLSVYIGGFVGSILLTILAYVSVVNKIFAGWSLVGLVVGLAFFQATVQLLCFLHLTSDEKPRWKLAVFLFMLVILVLVVGGSLWIMHSLSYRMSPELMLKYMNSQVGI